MNTLNLDAIEALVNAASLGPWRVAHGCVYGVRTHGDGDEDPEIAECIDGADAIFIAAARDDVPALVAEVRRLRAEATLVDECGVTEPGSPHMPCIRACGHDGRHIDEDLGFWEDE